MDATDALRRASDGRAAAKPRILLDFDGVLAPIVERPEDASVPPETRAELARLVDRYALVAVVSGRAGATMRDASSASTASSIVG